jgi:hypothetical protein
MAFFPILPESSAGIAIAGFEMETQANFLKNAAILDNSIFHIHSSSL